MDKKDYAVIASDKAVRSLKRARDAAYDALAHAEEAARAQRRVGWYHEWDSQAEKLRTAIVAMDARNTAARQV